MPFLLLLLLVVELAGSFDPASCSAAAVSRYDPRSSARDRHVPVVLAYATVTVPADWIGRRSRSSCSSLGLEEGVVVVKEAGMPCSSRTNASSSSSSSSSACWPSVADAASFASAGPTSLAASVPSSALSWRDGNSDDVRCLLQARYPPMPVATMAAAIVVVAAAEDVLPAPAAIIICLSGERSRQYVVQAK